MKKGLNIKEILFASTSRCNLNCAHCDIKKFKKNLNIKNAINFLNECKKINIKKVGFTGGEPFLHSKFLFEISKQAVKNKMFFSRIMTNASWFKSNSELKSKLTELFQSGYDGDFGVSVDAFHKSNLKKIALFIKKSIKIWNRADIISIFAVSGAKEKETKKILTKLSKILMSEIKLFNKTAGYIKNKYLFIKIFYIDLTAAGKSSRLKNPWDGKWFNDDYCQGPGNVFYVLPDESVKPCCGYANSDKVLTIGSISKDSPQKMIYNANKNIFISQIFSSGLHSIKKNMQKKGYSFPGKTSNHCFFCDYILKTIPRKKFFKLIRP